MNSEQRDEKLKEIARQFAFATPAEIPTIAAVVEAETGWRLTSVTIRGGEYPLELTAHVHAGDEAQDGASGFVISQSRKPTLWQRIKQAVMFRRA